MCKQFSSWISFKATLEFLCTFKLSYHYHILHLNINGLDLFVITSRWPYLPFRLRTISLLFENRWGRTAKDNAKTVSGPWALGLPYVLLRGFSSKRETAWSLLPISSYGHSSTVKNWRFSKWPINNFANNTILNYGYEH